VARLRSCELRLFAGDSGFTAGLISSGLFGDISGSLGGSGNADGGCRIVVSTIAAVESG
jgi:hypothetical protein